MIYKTVCALERELAFDIPVNCHFRFYTSLQCSELLHHDLLQARHVQLCNVEVLLMLLRKLISMLFLFTLRLIVVILEHADCVFELL